MNAFSEVTLGSMVTETATHDSRPIDCLIILEPGMGTSCLQRLLCQAFLFLRQGLAGVVFVPLFKCPSDSIHLDHESFTVANALLKKENQALSSRYLLEARKEKKHTT